jgi:hypothetical protein
LADGGKINIPWDMEQKTFFDKINDFNISILGESL